MDANKSLRPPYLDLARLEAGACGGVEAELGHVDVADNEVVVVRLGGLDRDGGRAVGSLDGEPTVACRRRVRPLLSESDQSEDLGLELSRFVDHRHVGEGSLLEFAAHGRDSRIVRPDERTVENEHDDRQRGQ